MDQLKRATTKPLGKILIERGVINEEQLTIALEMQKEKGGLFGEVLISLNFATEEHIAQALTCQYGFPYLPLANYKIDKSVLESVPEEICREFLAIPIDKIGNNLTVTMANPLNIDATKKIAEVSGCLVQSFVSTTTDINQAIEKYYQGK